MPEKFKAIVINQEGENFTREIKSLHINMCEIVYTVIWLSDTKPFFSFVKFINHGP